MAETPALCLRPIRNLDADTVDRIAAAADRGIGRRGQARAGGISRWTLRRWLDQGQALVDAGRPPVGQRERQLVRLAVLVGRKGRWWCYHHQFDILIERLREQDRETDALIARLRADSEDYRADWLSR